MPDRLREVVPPTNRVRARLLNSQRALRAMTQFCARGVVRVRSAEIFCVEDLRSFAVLITILVFMPACPFYLPLASKVLDAGLILDRPESLTTSP